MPEEEWWDTSPTNRTGYFELALEKTDDTKKRQKLTNGYTERSNFELPQKEGNGERFRTHT